MIKRFLSHRGFTLIELLLVIVIIMIVTAMSSVVFGRFINQTSAADVSTQISNQLRKAQSYAMTGKRNGNWGVRYQIDTLVLFQGNSYASRDTSQDEIIKLNSSVAISGLTEIVFSKTTGLPNVTPSITIVSGTSSKSLTVNSQGTISQ